MIAASCCSSQRTPRVCRETRDLTCCLQGMGKAKKAKKKAHRFDPLARPPAASSSMDVDGDAPIEAPPKVSAHMARFLERKRLQEEVKSLKQQKGKLKGMSKAEKRDVKARKKKLAHEIHERVARSNDKARAAVAPAEAQAADEEFRFELAAPAVELDDAWDEIGEPTQLITDLGLGVAPTGRP